MVKISECYVVNISPFVLGFFFCFIFLSKANQTPFFCFLSRKWQTFSNYRNWWTLNLKIRKEYLASSSFLPLSALRKHHASIDIWVRVRKTVSSLSLAFSVLPHPVPPWSSVARLGPGSRHRPEERGHSAWKRAACKSAPGMLTPKVLGSLWSLGAEGYPGSDKFWDIPERSLLYLGFHSPALLLDCVCLEPLEVLGSCCCSSGHRFCRAQQGHIVLGCSLGRLHKV